MNHNFIDLWCVDSSCRFQIRTIVINMKFPKRWLYHRLKKSCLLFLFLSIIFIITMTIFVNINSESTSRLMRSLIPNNGLHNGHPKRIKTRPGNK